jgi:hypothetical protein
MPYTRAPRSVRLPGRLLMGLSSALVCALLGACGGGDVSAADAEGSGSTPSMVADASPPRLAAAPPGHVPVGLALEALQRLSQPFGTAHQAIPAGVPPGYDWRERSRAGRGNVPPAGFGALTGWAQVFWVEGATVGAQRLEVRQHQTLLCMQSGGSRRWQRVQQGDIEGAAFRADFAGNANVAPEVERLAQGHWRIGFGAGRAYHFWPRQGRVVLGSDPLCGMLVLFEARAVLPDGRSLPPGTAAAMVAGAGADYWLNATAPWDHYRTNADVGIGPLRLVGPNWEWHGMGTAGPEALAQLARDGFVDRSPP